MSVSREEYDQMTKKATPPSRFGRNLVMSFVVGGGICALGEGFWRLYARLGFSKEMCQSLVPVTLVVLTAILTVFGVFDRIAKVAGAGTGVPITGFANAVVAPAIEFQSDGKIMGVGQNIFRLAGPVLAWGSGVCAVYGVIYYVITTMKK
ncbi:MAG: SpoVA/SpoVAEb family sporulation membrane protein [Oscillospiraceae bacterium]|jgi:stage V sporulation protein AC|nr:SpoVA/SpoVAEb family sporulation membrane protein [Oscillospiraceae bacterium]